MGWFGRKSVLPAGPAFAPGWLRQDSGSGQFAQGYEAQFDEVFRNNPVGQRSVRLVAGMVSSLTIDGPDEAVRLIGADLLERIAAGLMLEGNAYVQLIPDGHDRPAELHALPPERVSVVLDAKGWPGAYEYRAGQQVTRVARRDPLGRQQLAHLKALKPMSSQRRQPGRGRGTTGN